MVPPGSRGRVSVAVLLFLAGCGSASDRPLAPTVSASAAPSVSVSTEPRASAAPTATYEPAMVRLGPLGFGAAPTYLAISADERLVADSIGMAGAEVEVFDARATQVMKFFVDLDCAVRAIDFSPDGGTLLVSITGGKKRPSMLQWVSVPEGKVLRSVDLAIDDASERFRRGAEGHFLSDGSVVAVTGGKLMRWEALNGKAGTTEAQALGDLPGGAFLSTSPDKQWLVVSAPDEVSVRTAKQITRVATRKPRTSGDGGYPSAGAFVTNQGAFTYQDKGEALVVDEHGISKSLGPGEPMGLSPRHVLVGAHDRPLVDIVDRKSGTRVPVAAVKAWLSPQDTTLYAHTGADADDAVSVLPLPAVLDGSLVMLHSEPRSLAFSLDGKSVIVEDGGHGVVEWDLATRKVARRVELPKASEHLQGIFRTAHDVLVMAGDVYRLGDHGAEPIGGTYFSRPKAFVRKDGSTVVCVSDAAEVCQAHFVLTPDRKGLEDIYWGFIFPLGDGRGFAEGPYAPEGSDLGASRMEKRQGGTQPLETTWLRTVSLHWAVPAEEGGVILDWETKEGGEPGSRAPMLRRVRAGGVGTACPLGDVRPASASMTLSSNGHTVAIPLEGKALLLVEVDACTATRVALPGRPAGVDFSPDGRSVAVGLVDRTVVVFQVPAMP